MKYTTTKVTSKTLQAIREVSRLTGVKMYAAMERAAIDLLARVKANGK